MHYCPFKFSSEILTFLHIWEQVQTLFHADGDGLPRPEIAALCGPLSALLDVMALDTGILIANYEQVGAAGSRVAPAHADKAAGWASGAGGR